MNLMELVRYERLAPLLSLFLTVTLHGIQIGHVHGDSFGTFRRYAAYDYDLTTPQFTPDGRLLQVEYATNACRRDGTNPIVSVGIDIPSDRTFRLLRTRLGEACERLADDDDGDKHYVSSLKEGEKEEEEGDTILVMATVTSSTLMEPPLTNHNQEVDRNTFSESRGEVNVRQQFRIIEVPISAAYNHIIESTNPSARHITAITTSTILIGLSGHLSDATKLLQTIYSHLEEEQSIFGWHRLGVSPVGQDIKVIDNKSSHLLSHSQSVSAQPTETVFRLARAAADQCQKHAFGGGLRPLGASLLLSAVDTQHCHQTCNGYQQYGRVAMCETDPSGRLKNIVSNIKSQCNKDSHETLLSPPQVMVSGGSAKSQSALMSMVQSRLRELQKISLNGPNFSDDAALERTKQERAKGTIDSSNAKLAEVCDKDLYTRRALQAVLSSLLDEWRSRLDPQLSAHALSSEGLISRFQQRIGYDKLSVQSRQQMPLMEVVFVSSRRGSFRLTDGDIFGLLKEYFEDDSK